jgi:hypothetical protein
MKFRAKLINGPNHGQILELEEVRHSIQIAYRIPQGNGEWLAIKMVMYRLKSTEPLEYEFEPRFSN